MDARQSRISRSMRTRKKETEMKHPIAIIYLPKVGPNTQIQQFHLVPQTHRRG
jgi:hypothetical protein